MPSFVNMPISTLISENLYDVVYFCARRYLRLDALMMLS